MKAKICVLHDFEVPNILQNHSYIWKTLKKYNTAFVWHWIHQAHTHDTHNICKSLL